MLFIMVLFYLRRIDDICLIFYLEYNYNDV